MRNQQISAYYWPFETDHATHFTTFFSACVTLRCGRLSMPREGFLGCAVGVAFIACFLVSIVWDMKKKKFYCNNQLTIMLVSHLEFHCLNWMKLSFKFSSLFDKKIFTPGWAMPVLRSSSVRAVVRLRPLLPCGVPVGKSWQGSGLTVLVFFENCYKIL